MRFRLSRRTKQRLANRYGHNLLFRLLLFKFWFRVAFIGLLLLLAVLGLCLPKLWTVSTPGAGPVVRLSVIDWAQGALLKRAAAREAQAGKPAAALEAWTAASIINPADAAALRGILSALSIDPPVEPESVDEGVRQGLRLLTVTRTNAADLELFAGFLEKVASPARVTEGLESAVSRLNPNGQAIFLKALFAQGRVSEFRSRWEEWHVGSSADAELSLYDAAWQAGWGNADEVARGAARLQAAATSGSQAALATRLQMAVAAHRKDAVTYGQCLERLQERRLDSTTDHTTYWRLLAQGGERERARELASQYAEGIRSAEACAALIQALGELDLVERARRYFKNPGDHFWAANSVWLAYAAALTQARDWDELRRIAVQIRTEPRLHQRLTGYSYFLEALAFDREDQKERARDALRKMNQLWSGDPELVLAAAETVLQLGYPAEAGELLSRFERELRTHPAYGALRTDVTRRLQNQPLAAKQERQGGSEAGAADGGK